MEVSNVHTSKFFEQVKFVDKDYPAMITDNVKDYMKDVHPTQFLNASFSFPMFEITYDYCTSRNGKTSRTKIAKKYIFVQELHDDVEFEINMKFEDWVSKFNQSNKHRAISNVSILEIRQMANARLELAN